MKGIKPYPRNSVAVPHYNKKSTKIERRISYDNLNPLDDIINDNDNDSFYDNFLKNVQKESKQSKNSLKHRPSGYIGDRSMNLVNNITSININKMSNDKTFNLKNVNGQFCNLKQITPLKDKTELNVNKDEAKKDHHGKSYVVITPVDSIGNPAKIDEGKMPTKQESKKDVKMALLNVPHNEMVDNKRKKSKEEIPQIPLIDPPKPDIINENSTHHHIKRKCKIMFCCIPIATSAR